MAGTKGRSGGKRPNTGGRRNESAAANDNTVGRTPRSYRIEQDHPIRINYVGNDGGFSEIANGSAQIRKTPNVRMIVIPTADGEIRICL